MTCRCTFNPDPSLNFAECIELKRFLAWKLGIENVRLGRFIWVRFALTMCHWFTQNFFIDHYPNYFSGFSLHS